MFAPTAVPLLVQTVDCGKFSEDAGSKECEERADLGIGVLVVVVVVALVVGWVAWRLLLRRSRGRASSDES